MTTTYTIDQCPDCGGYLYPDTAHECRIPSTATPEGKWCWWFEDDERFHFAESESEAHGEASCQIDNECEPGEERTYTVSRVVHPMDYIGMDWIAKQIGNDIEENICCWCDDDIGAEEPSIELTKEDREELGRMVAAFVRKKAGVHWWAADKNAKTEHTYIAGSND